MNTLPVLEWMGVFLPLLPAFCFLGLSEKRTRLFPALGRAAVFCGLLLFLGRYPLPGPLSLCVQFAALFLCTRPLRKGAGQAFFTCSLLFCVLCLSNGISGAAGGWLCSRLPEKWASPAVFALLLYLLSAALCAALLFGIRAERACPPEGGQAFLPGFLLFFIGAAGQTVSDALYGNPAVLCQLPGEAFCPPAGDGFPLQLFSLFALLCTLSLCRLLQGAAQSGRLFMQQLERQAVFLKEAQTRQQKARAFRHDLNNHLLLLRALLKAGKAEEAAQYLCTLKGMAEELSCPCETGNPAVDALLSGKLSLAGQEGIRVFCRLKIPEGVPVTAADWCALFANALDNAAAACLQAEAERRYIRITGGQHGRFLFICIENGCAAGGPDFREGTGLLSIRAAVRKYRGTVEIERSDGRFRLCILLPIS